MVGNDTSDEIRVRVSQRDHQLIQLLLVQLRNGSEHALSAIRQDFAINTSGSRYQFNSTSSSDILPGS